MNFTNLEHGVANDSICSPRENFVDMLEPALDTIPILVLSGATCCFATPTTNFDVKQGCGMAQL